MNPGKTYGASVDEPAGQAVPWQDEATGGIVRATGTANRGATEADAVIASVEEIPAAGGITHDPNNPSSSGTSMTLDGNGKWCGHLGSVIGNVKYGIKVWATFGAEHDYAFHTFKTAKDPSPIANCP